MSTNIEEIVRRLATASPATDFRLLRYMVLEALIENADARAIAYRALRGATAQNELSA